MWPAGRSLPTSDLVRDSSFLTRTYLPTQLTVVVSMQSDGKMCRIDTTQFLEYLRSRFLFSFLKYEC